MVRPRAFGAGVAVVARFLASASWAAAAIAKIAFPAAARIGGLTVPPSFVVGFGCAKFLLAVAWWVPHLRRVAAISGLLAVVGFFLAMEAGWITPEFCACFGRLQISKARHVLALGLLAIFNSLGFILDLRERPDEPALLPS